MLEPGLGLGGPLWLSEASPAPDPVGEKCSSRRLELRKLVLRGSESLGEKGVRRGKVWEQGAPRRPSVAS